MTSGKEQINRHITTFFVHRLWPCILQEDKWDLSLVAQSHKVRSLRSCICSHLPLISHNAHKIPGKQTELFVLFFSSKLHFISMFCCCLVHTKKPANAGTKEGWAAIRGSFRLKCDGKRFQKKPS